MSKPGYEGVLERYDEMGDDAKPSWYESREWLVQLIEWKNRAESRLKRCELLLQVSMACVWERNQLKDNVDKLLLRHNLDETELL